MKYAKKSLGQNFLIDLNIVKKITSLTNITNKNILEIGPGKGILTDQLLLQKPKSLILVEKDIILCETLKLKYKKFKQVKIYNDDILKFNLEEKLKKDTIIFGNLPYNISSQILTKIIRIKTKSIKFSYLVFMFQKEMADRIIGKYGTPEYGRLSILTNYKLNILSKFNVSPNCFFPKPKVDSTVLLFKPKNKIIEKIKKIENLEKITNILFSNRRKMINKNILKIINTDQINLIDDLNLKSRPSELRPEKYYKITELFEKFN